MNSPRSKPLTYRRMGSIETAGDLRAYASALGAELPVEDRMLSADESPLARPYDLPDGFTITNRWCCQPMEGWDCTRDGRPTELTLRRWRGFGRSGAKLIWGGEAAAVREEGRANPHQLRVCEDTQEDLAHLRQTLLDAHRERMGDTSGLLIGLQLTHSGRFCRPNEGGNLEPRIAYHHPLLDRKFGIAPDHPILTDGEIETIIACYGDAARIAQSAGFDFVDVKHCHGYLGHEFLSARRRPGPFGGSFENRTRFLRMIVADIRRKAPGLRIGVRLSAFDMPPFRPGRDGVGEPDDYETPYDCVFGADPESPLSPKLDESVRFLELLQSLDVRLVNISAGSPYYNPHVTRPAMFPPSDGYLPPEDPLLGVMRHIRQTAELKRRFPQMAIVGSGYTYLQEWVPQVAQSVVRTGDVDFVGLGRMMLPYPEMCADVLEGRPLQHKRICRTFSDCTTAPRHGIVSGCYPLDPFYKERPEASELKRVKKSRQ